MMKQKILSLLLALCSMGLLCGCSFTYVEVDESMVDEKERLESIAETETVPETDPATDAPTEAETESETEPETDAATEVTSEEEPEIVWGETYTAPEDVAEYLYLYGELPENYISKKDARELGWESSEGNLWEVAPGMSIGGDYFGNYEGLLPEGHYRECDVNYDGGYRGSERIIFGEDGSIYYTDDHYESFTQLY